MIPRQIFSRTVVASVAAALVQVALYESSVLLMEASAVVTSSPAVPNAMVPHARKADGSSLSVTPCKGVNVSPT